MNRAYVAVGFLMFGISALTWWGLAHVENEAPEGSAIADAIALKGRPMPHRETPEIYTAGPVVDIIDLSRTFEPTGDELALQNLLKETEIELPLPREVAEELAMPRQVAVADGKLKLAGQEESSPPDRLEQLGRSLGRWVAAGCAELLLRSLPLQGSSEVPAMNP